MNPEFKRNLWLSFSPYRLIGMPAVLGLVLAAIAINSGWSHLGSAASMLFIGIVWLWGTKNAAAAIGDEWREHTWDQQRMSALSPWEMTWGKLFGATLYNWYGGALCLLVLLLSDLPQDPFNTLCKALTLIAMGLLLNASALVLNLQLGQSALAQSRRGSFNLLLAIPALFAMPYLYEQHDSPILWWGMLFAPLQFQLLAGFFFAGCAVFAAWRLMQNALQVRTRPWAWPLFACLLTGFLTGFNHDNLPVLGLIISASMTYVTLFSEPNGITVWRRVLSRLQAKNSDAVLMHLPLWPTTLLLSFAFALLATAYPQTSDLAPASAAPLAIALMVLRDSAICLFFAFSPNTRRATATSLLYLVVINGLLPFLAHSSGLNTLAYFIMPVSHPVALNGILVSLIHAAMALALVRWRWQALND